MCLLEPLGSGNSTDIRLHFRLIEGYLDQARRHGITGHRVNTWVRRKLGPRIAVWRTRADGSLGCAIPCLLCQRELVRFDLTVFYTQSTGTWASGRPALDSWDALGARLTSGQRRQWNNWQPPSQPASKVPPVAVGKSRPHKQAQK